MLQIGTNVHCLVMFETDKRKRIEMLKGTITTITKDSYIVETKSLKCPLYYSFGQEGKTIFLSERSAEHTERSLQGNIDEEERDQRLKEPEYSVSTK